jgi:O-acetylserine/cysteine efflux transporter
MPLRDLVLVVLVCAAWGFNFTAGAKGMEGFPPLLFMVLRFLGVLTLTLLFLRPPPPGQWVRLAAVALTMGGLHFTFLFWALRLSEDVTSIAVLQIMYIPIAVLLAWLLLRERTGWRTLAATATAFAGVMLIGFDPLVLQQPAALALVLLSALAQALASVLMRGLHGIGPMNFQAWTAVFALPCMLAGTLLFEQGQWQSIKDAEPLHWAALAYTVVIASLVGHGLFFVLVQRHPVPQLMPYLLLMTPLGALFGVLVWGDRPGPRLIVGGVIILGSILFITLRGRRRAGAALVAARP